MPERTDSRGEALFVTVLKRSLAGGARAGNSVSKTEAIEGKQCFMFYRPQTKKKSAIRKDLLNTAH